MSRIYPIVILLAIFAFSCNTSKESTSQSSVNQPQTDSAKVYLAFENLRASCRACSGNGDCKEASKYVVYRAKEDWDRAWKDVSGYEPGDDQNFVDISCKGINKFLPKGKEFKVTKFYQEKESEGIWNVLTIVFEDAGKTRFIEAAFLKVKDQYLLGDLEGYIRE